MRTEVRIADELSRLRSRSVDTEQKSASQIAWKSHEMDLTGWETMINAAIKHQETRKEEYKPSAPAYADGQRKEAATLSAVCEATLR
jgi:hypothetical protein